MLAQRFRLYPVYSFLFCFFKQVSNRVWVILVSMIKIEKFYPLYSSLDLKSILCFIFPFSVRTPETFFEPTVDLFYIKKLDMLP